MHEGYAGESRSPCRLWKYRLGSELTILLETYLKELDLPHFEDEDLGLFWLLDQMTPEERREWDLESAFLETLYPEFPDADFETKIREADRRIEAGLMPPEEELLALV